VDSAHDWFCCLSLGPQGVSGLAMDAAGRSYFVVQGVNDFGDPPLPGPNFVLVGADGIVVQGRQQLDPSWSNAGAGGTNGGSPQIAVDPDGNGCDLRSMITGAAHGRFSHLETAAPGTAPGQGLQLAPLPDDGALVVYRKSFGSLKARRFLPPPLRRFAVSSRLAVADTLADGVPVTVDVGVDGTTVKAKLLDSNGVLGPAMGLVGRKTRRDAARGVDLLHVKLTSAAAAQVAGMARFRMTVRVIATAPDAAKEVVEKSVVLKQ
jgi:hypothetical protein